ncbi:hypothetical protein [Acetobacter senegalensis]|uniref:hypothetical protein n=1 Tax=Acetobacter senegalensis TaxID=446692 RepID=UPI001D04A0C2|nr:hypothetical protein [Acetobacter senegalensis]
MAHAIKIAGVEKRDPSVQRGMDGSDAFFPISRTIHAGHAHTPKTDFGYLRAALTKLPQFHISEKSLFLEAEPYHTGYLSITFLPCSFSSFGTERIFRLMEQADRL